MALTQINPPYPIYTDIDGDPLDNGFVYFGVANEDPETNPITVYYDSALTIPAVQPLRTSGGYIFRNGTPAVLWTDVDYSITVRNKAGAFVYYNPTKNNVTGVLLAENNLSDLDDIDQAKANLDIGAGDVSFTQVGFGATEQTVSEKLGEVVSVKDFGAIGDGVTDDTAAVQACVTAAVAAGRTIYVPVGTYALTAQITASGPFEIHGESLRKSRLLWTSGASTRGIAVTLGSSGGFRDTFRAFNLSILTAGAGVGRGLQITDTTPGDRYNPSVRINNIVVGGSAGLFDTGWNTNIWMDACQGAFIDGCDLYGKIASGGEPNYDTQYAIYYANPSLASPHQTEFGVTNCSIKLVDTAIYADDMEGLVVSDNQIVGVGTGVYARGADTFPHVSIVNNHVNAAEVCIVVDKMYQAIIIGNLLYCQQGTTAGTGIDIVSAAKYFNITGNQFENLKPAVECNSIIVSSGSDGVIDGNIFRRSDSVDGTQDGIGVWLTSGASNVKVGANNVFDASQVAFPFSDDGTGNNTAAVSLDISGWELTAQGLISQWGSSVITLDGSGNGSIALPRAFKSAFYTAIACNGDPSFLGSSGFCVNQASSTTTTLAVSVRPNPGAVMVRFNWNAFGR